MGHGLKLMSNNDQIKIANAVLKAIDLSNEGLKPSEAIAKVASDNNFNADVVQRMVEAFNTGKTLAVYEKAAGAARVAEFTQASADEVMKLAYPQAACKKEASVKEAKCDKNHAVRKSYLKPKHKEVEKAAAEHTDTYADNLDRNAIVGDIYAELDRYRPVLDECRREKTAAVNGYEEAVDNLRTFFRYQLKDNQLQKYAAWEGKIARAFGEKGWKLMGIVHNKLANSKIKRASVLPNNVYDNLNTAPYTYVKQALDCLTKAVEVSEEMGNLENKIQQVKEAVSAPFAKAAGSNLPQGPSKYDLDRLALEQKKFDQQSKMDESRYILQFEKNRQDQLRQDQEQERKKIEDAQIKGPSATSVLGAAAKVINPSGEFKTLKDTIGGVLGGYGKMRTGQPYVPQGDMPELDALKSKLTLELALRDMMTNDEVISKYEPQEVTRTVNQILQFSPILAKNPMGLKAILRKALEQGGVLESFDIAQEVDTGRKLQQMREGESSVSRER